MGRFSVELTKGARKSLAKLDSSVANVIVNWIAKNLNNCENPRAHGKPLTGNLRDQWSYRIGDYRIIAQIVDERVLILVLSVDHRSEAYRR